jgi:hypothetical protein
MTDPTAIGFPVRKSPEAPEGLRGNERLRAATVRERFWPTAPSRSRLVMMYQSSVNFCAVPYDNISWTGRVPGATRRIGRPTFEAFCFW